MKSIRVMVVDDSAQFRQALTRVLESLPGVEVVATCSDGQSALETVRTVKPDLITLDLEMPSMGGIETLCRLRGVAGSHHVMVVSAHSSKGARLTIDALCHGAVDFVSKMPENVAGRTMSFREQLETKMLQLFPQQIGKIPTPNLPTSDSRAAKQRQPLATTARASEPLPSSGRRQAPEVVLIGVSTGGPNALTTLFSELSDEISVPILIAQHMPPNFTKLLAERLSSRGKVLVTEGQEGEVLVGGRAYIAPGDFHMEVRRKGPRAVLHLHQQPKIHSCRPAVDLLFQSAAKVYQSRCLGIVMTGMGSDGALGAKAVTDAGGEILIQDPESSVVYGMPNSVAELGVPHRVVELAKLAGTIASKVLRKSALTP